MKKSELRKVYLEKRRLLSDDRYELLNLKIKDQFFDYFFLNQVKNIHTFLPIVKNKEVNTWTIIERLRKKEPHVNIIASRSNPSDCSLENFYLQPETIIKENKWGIPEPENAVPFDGDLDIILVPLLIFDQSGQRVGYGKGFYDRFLKDLSPATIKAGICFEEPIERIEDTNEFDIKLDICLTPDKVYEFLG